MKKQILYTLWLLAPVALWAQEQNAAPIKVDLSDVVIVEDIPASSTTEVPSGVVVEIPRTPVEGASLDMETPDIQEITEALPIDIEIVLEVPGQEAEVPSEATLAGEETISVDFPDEDIRTILRNVADLFELNLVIPDTLQGRTSIKLRNVSWRQVFDEVLRQIGFTYVEDRNIIRITSIEELTTEPVDTRVFVVNYARAEDLRNALGPLVDPVAGGQIQVDTRSNALVITERPSQMNKIQEIIERLDKATDQVLIESKFIEVTNTDVKNLGVNWSSLSGYNVSAGPFERSITNTETDSFSGSTKSVSDFPINLDDVLEAQKADFDDGEPVDSVFQPPAIYEDPYSFSDTFSDVKSTVDTALFSAGEFEVILSALKTNNDVELVSNPTVVTLNNTKAKIAIGERYPIPSYTFNAETGQRQLDEITYEDIGINLDVTPQVNSAGFITLNIIPEVSSTDRFSIIENTQIPIIESRRTETSIVIKDGYTLAIGGLVENSDVDRGTKVPVLGDLPGIGRLFRSESDEISSRNLIIFITAKTLNPDGSTYRDIIDPRVINQMGILPSDVPGYQVPQDQIATYERIEEVREKTTNEEEILRLRASLEALENAEALRLRTLAEEAEASKAVDHK